MKRLIGLFALAATLVGGSANAQSWVMVSQGGDRVVGFDQDSVRRDGNRSTIWNIMINKGTEDVDRSRYDYILRRLVIDCEAETYRELAVNYYDIRGNSVYAPEPRGTTNVSPPGTIMAKLMLAVCGGFDGEYVFADAKDAVTTMRSVWPTDE